jgi:hypothetical protein
MALRSEFLTDTPLDNEIIEVRDDKGELILDPPFVEEMTEEQIMGMSCIQMSEEECQETKRRLIEVLRKIKT